MSGTLEQQIANLRLQIDALGKATRAASLPGAVRAVRRTVRWSAVLIALALVASSMVRLVYDRRVEAVERRMDALEKRVEQLEKAASM